jgi:hypothetical protein
VSIDPSGATGFLPGFGLGGVTGSGGDLSIRLRMSSPFFSSVFFSVSDMSETFYGPWLKIKRADSHIKELEREFFAYEARYPDGISRHINLKTGYVVEKIGGSFSEHTPTIIGDVVHNLRASLDHAFCVLVSANKNSVDRYTFFPFADDETALKARIKGIQKVGACPSAEVVDLLFSTIKPYRGTDLYGVHDLDIADKHRSLIPTISRVTIKTMATADGSIFNNCFFESAANHDPSYGGGAAMTAIRRIGDPCQIHGDFSGKICFPYGSPFAGKEIVPTIKYMREIVSGVLKTLEPFAG